MSIDFAELGLNQIPPFGSSKLDYNQKAERVGQAAPAGEIDMRNEAEKAIAMVPNIDERPPDDKEKDAVAPKLEVPLNDGSDCVMK